MSAMMFARGCLWHNQLGNVLSVGMPIKVQRDFDGMDGRVVEPVTPETDGFENAHRQLFGGEDEKMVGARREPWLGADVEQFAIAGTINPIVRGVVTEGMSGEGSQILACRPIGPVHP